MEILTHSFNENGRLNPYLVDLNGKPIKPVRNISVEDYYQAKQAEIDKTKSSSKFSGV